MAGRAYARNQRKRSINKQLKLAKMWGIYDQETLKDPEFQGKLSKNRGVGCSCALCKPHKHGWEHPEKVKIRNYINETDKEMKKFEGYNWKEALFE